MEDIDDPDCDFFSGSAFQDSPIKIDESLNVEAKKDTLHIPSDEEDNLAKAVSSSKRHKDTLQLDSKVSSLEHVKDDVVADLTCEFLEIAIHQILYHRGIYPKDIFRVYKKYHLSIHMSGFPGLTEYIAGILKSLKPMIEKKEIMQVVVHILQNGKSFERFVFELLADSKCPVQKSDNEYLLDLEVSLRECLLRLATYNAPLPTDPENCTFQILVHMDGSSALQLLFDDDSPVQWMKDESVEGDSANEKKLYPIKTIKGCPYMKLQLYALSG